MATVYLTKSGINFQYIVDNGKPFYTASVQQGYDVSSSPFSNALNFNGTSAKVALGNPSILSPTDYISISCWINPSDHASSQIYGINYNHGLWIDANKKIVMEVQVDGARQGLDAGDRYQLSVFNTWYHIVGIGNAAGGKTELYVNGDLIKSVTFTPGVLTYTGLTNRFIGSGNGYFKGLIDDVRVYNSVLSQNDITNLYNGINKTDGLISYWKFDEGSGTNALDSSGNGITGTITNATYTNGPTQLVKTIFPGSNITATDPLY